MTWQKLILVVIWIWRNWMNPQLPNPGGPLEIIEAFRSLTETAHKLGHLADTINSWALPVTLAIGVVLGMFFANSRRS